MNAVCAGASTPHQADPDRRGMTVAERASSSLPTSEECSAMAHAMAIRARAELVEIYARVYQSWTAAEQMMRDAAAQASTTASAA